MRLFLFLLVLSCRRADPSIAPTPERRAPAVDQGDLPRVRVLADVAAHQGKRVIVEGTYEIDPLAGKGKGHHLTWIVLDDGTRISRAYGALEEEYGYADRRVVVRGKLTSGPPDDKVQSLLAPHVAAEEIRLIDGSTAPSVTSIPAPPVVSAAPSAAPRIDRWVQLVGSLSKVSADAFVTLSDGAVVRVERVDAGTWTPHVGTTVTITGRIALEKGAGTFGLELVIRGPTAICAGVVARCGM